MHFLDLTKLQLAEVTAHAASEQLNWETNLLAYQIDPAHVIILDIHGAMIAVRLPVEKLIARFAQDNLLMSALNVASHKVARQKYCGIVHGRYQLIPSAGFDNSQKCWIMAHHLKDVYAHDKTGIVTLVFRVDGETTRVLIDANLTSLKKRLKAADSVSRLQSRVFKALKRSMGFAKKKPEYKPVSHDLSELKRLVCAWGLEIVSVFFAARYGSKLTIDEEAECRKLICKAVTGRSLSKERRRMAGKKKKK